MYFSKWSIGILILALGSSAWAGNSTGTTPLPAKGENLVTGSNLPARKPGLWEVTVRSDDLVLRRKGQAKPTAQTVRMCTDAATEPVMLLAIIPGQENCHNTTNNTSPGEGWSIHTSCTVHGNPVETDVHITGDLATKYQGSFVVKYPDSPLNNSGRTVFEGRWLGPCLQGEQPGDMLLPNGVRVNVVRDRQRAKSHSH